MKKNLYLFLFAVITLPFFSQNFLISAPDVTEEMLCPQFWIEKQTDADKIRMTETEIGLWNKKNNNIFINDSPLTKDLRTFAEENNLKKAVCVFRTDIKILPEEAPQKENPWEFDYNQDSAILMNEPVAVEKESQDGKWYYIHSFFKSGWVIKSAVAFCTSNQWDKYFDYTSSASPAFITVTADNYYIRPEYFIPETIDIPREISENSCHIFMGTYLHIVEWTEEFITACKPRVPHQNYLAEIPYKKNDETLGIRYATIPVSVCVKGLLPFTTSNFILLAFQTLGERYGWGGMEDSRDCSAFSSEIFRCFGFMFPRDSGPQAQMAGKTYNLQKLSDEEREKIYSSLPAGAIISFPGHIFIYLGKFNNQHYVINAAGGYLRSRDSQEIKALSVHINTLNIFRQNGKTWAQTAAVIKLLTLEP